MVENTGSVIDNYNKMLVDLSEAINKAKLLLVQKDIEIVELKERIEWLEVELEDEDT